MKSSKHTSEEDFSIFPLKKPPSKSNQSSIGRETTPEEEGSGDKEILQPPPWL